MRFIVALVGCLLLGYGSAPAQQYKRLPPTGIKISSQSRNKLTESVDRQQSEVERLANELADTDRWFADVHVLHRALRLALEQELFFGKEPQAIGAAETLLKEAGLRLGRVRDGKRGLPLLGFSPDRVDEPQLLVGGFVSRIDDSVQPYGLVVPAGFDPSQKTRYRLDVWLHGRGDTKTEVPFLVERMTKIGRYAPPDTFVLHPFGRHCNAFKFAGETDVYEAMEHVRGLIDIDENRISIRGFSMGGAGCWHLAVHDPGRWLSANPGAGFVDTIEYQGWKESGPPFALDENRRRLMNWYDVLPWVSNLQNTRTVAYSGEVDKQKQAADRVFAVAKQSNIEFPYVIGKGMGHKIDPESAEKIDSQISQWAGEPTELPRREIDFTTYTLRYNQARWLQILGLRRHWSPGRVRARITSDHELEMTTEGVTRLKVDFRASGWPKRPVNAQLKIDGQSLTIEDWDVAPGIQCELKRDETWSVVEAIDPAPRKRPGLQGPIDDAFCDRFVFVLPSRPARHGVVQRWIDRELEYAQSRWRRLMRGNVPVVRDTELTEEQIENCHLVCFGDFSSNRYLANVAAEFPVKWTSEKLQVGTKTFDPSVHAAVFCFPNPGNPNRYLVVNSGMTFREFSNVSNSRQIAMLPDWAVMKVDEADDGIFAGKMVADGFFDEQWKLSE